MKASQHLKDKGYEVDVKYGMSPGELLDIIDDYDSIIVRKRNKGKCKTD